MSGNHEHGDLGSRNQSGGFEVSPGFEVSADAVLKPQEAEASGAPERTIAELVTFAECPPGLFWYGRTLALKTEYRTAAGHAEAFVCDSGEAFWGQATNFADRDRLLVLPCEDDDLGRPVTDFGVGNNASEPGGGEQRSELNPSPTDELLEALRAADEALAQVTAFEEDARYIMGNTNFNIVKMRRAQVQTAIAKHEPKPDTQGAI
jgi:hypothetical protein